MRNVMTIAVRELVSYFTSPMAYVALFFFLGVSGLIFMLSMSSGAPKAEMQGMFQSMIFLTLLMAPVITMGLLAQETNSGTYELLMTKPLTDLEVALGKFLGAMGLYIAILLVSLEFPLILAKYGSPDWGEILSGYIGLLAAGLAFLAVGVFTSSLTSNQIAAWLMATFLLLFLWLVGWLSYGGTSWVGNIAKAVSAYENYRDFSQGIVDAKNILYFLSVCFFFLFLTARTLEGRRTVS